MTHARCIRGSLAATLCVSLAPFVNAQGTEPDSEHDTLQEALENGRTWVNFRYRFENVDQDGLAKEARASTLRTVLGYESGKWEGFSVLLEAEDVSEVGNDLYNSTVNGRLDRPVVADPDGTEVNQAYLQYAGFDQTLLRAGRQRVTLANQRFVGNVGWRQNEQTYDAWMVQTEAAEGLVLTGAYVSNVNRVVGDANPAGNFSGNTILLHGAGEFEEVGEFNAYYYDLDFESAATLSTATFGASFDGSFDVDTVGCTYRLELAAQSDSGDNPMEVDANYTNVEVGAKAAGVGLKVGLEILEGSGAPGDKFSTPLATGHKFNGWADQFLTTPDNGLEDLYFSVGGTWRGTDLAAVYHDFSANEGGGAYGSEVDLLAQRKFASGVVGGVKLASYSADGFSADTTKGWFWLGYSF